MASALPKNACVSNTKQHDHTSTPVTEPTHCHYWISDITLTLHQQYSCPSLPLAVDTAHGCSGEVRCCSQKPVSSSSTCMSCDSRGTLPSGLRLPCHNTKWPLIGTSACKNLLLSHRPHLTNTYTPACRLSIYDTQTKQRGVRNDFFTSPGVSKFVLLHSFHSFTH